jgi:hypothetical protein
MVADFCGAIDGFIGVVFGLSVVLAGFIGFCGVIDDFREVISDFSGVCDSRFLRCDSRLRWYFNWLQLYDSRLQDTRLIAGFSGVLHGFTDVPVSDFVGECHSWLQLCVSWFPCWDCRFQKCHSWLR